MNIFVLSLCIRLCARYHNDTHMRKMIIEYAQLLSTAHRLLNPECPDVLYKASHVNHPSNVWCRETKSNYRWLYKLYKCLCEEYTFRTDKIHASARFLNDLANVPPGVPEGPLTPFALAMPNECKVIGIEEPDDEPEELEASSRESLEASSRESLEAYISDYDHDFDYSQNIYQFRLAVQSYRNYYNMHKQTYTRKTGDDEQQRTIEVPFTVWTKREVSYWFVINHLESS